VYDIPLNLPVENTGHVEPPTVGGTIASRNDPPRRPNLPVSLPASTEQTIQSAQMPSSRAESLSPKPPTSLPVNVLERVKEELMSSLSLGDISAKTQPEKDSSGLVSKGEDTIKGTKPSIESVKPPIALTEGENVKSKTSEATNQEATVTSSTGTTRTSNTTGTTRSGETETSAASSSLRESPPGSVSPEGKDPAGTNPASIPSVPSHTSISEVALFEPGNTPASAPLLPAKESNSATPASFRDPVNSPPFSPKSPGPGTYFPSMNETHDSSRPSPTPIFDTRSTTRSQAPSNPAQPPPNSPHAPASYAGGAVGRTVSIDSMTSNGSLVAAMRDRYNVTSSPPPPHPTGRRGDIYAQRNGRDGQMSPREREGGRVSDMASRFTPIEGPLPPSGSSGYSRPGFPVPSLSGRERIDYNPGPGFGVGDTLPIRTPLRRSSVDEFGSSSAAAGSASLGGRRGGETMPHPDRRQTVMTPIGTSSPVGALQASYDIHLSELELQQREMELEIHRKRLQLAKEKEALNAREREREMQGESEYHSGRGYGDRYGSRDVGVEGPYARGAYGRDGGYESPAGREVYSPPRGYALERTFDHGRSSTPRLGGQMPDPHGDRDRSAPRGGGGESAYHDMSTGLGVMGLSLPPGAGSPMGSMSRESLSLSPPLGFSPPVAQPTSKGRDPSPRRSAEGTRMGEKEKGGTWLGKGLKRFSMNT